MLSIFDDFGDQIKLQTTQKDNKKSNHMDLLHVFWRWKRYYFFWSKVIKNAQIIENMFLHGFWPKSDSKEDQERKL